LCGAGKALTSAPNATEIEELAMTVRSLRNVEKQKKKARRALPRKKLSRNQGNTLRARRQLKKMAGKARAAKAAAKV
jgi:hypothetical protein